MTEAGEPYCYLKGCAYLLRTEGNRELIAAIEGGSRRRSAWAARWSGRCAPSAARSSTPAPREGAEYGGRRCWAELVGATDAYEWSFVAVPPRETRG